MKCIKCKTNEAMKDATMCLECAKEILALSIGHKKGDFK